MGILSRYKKELIKAEELYKSIGSVHCPFFNKKIPFTADGFHHLRYNNSESEREKAAQIHKFKYINAAKQIIESAGTVQEYRKQWGIAGSKRYGNGMKPAKEIQYWGFVGILNIGTEAIRVKTIVRKVGNGEPQFWSVMCETDLKKSSSYKLAKEDIANE